MPHKKLIFCSIILLIYVSVSPAQNADSLNFHYRLSTRAYQSEDYNEFLNHTLQALRFAPDNFTLQYNLACAYALTGHAGESLQILNGLLDKGIEIAINAETDTDLEVIRKMPEFTGIMSKIQKLKKPVINSETAFVIPENDLIPEGITYDPVENCFYMGSIYKAKIIRISADGKVSNFTSEKQDGLVPVIGMKVDARRRLLWAVSSYGTRNDNIPENMLGISGVFKFDLSTGELLKKYMLPQQEWHFLNDLAFTVDGDVYVTDSNQPAVYKISAQKDTIEKFVDLEQYRYPNGIAVSDDGKKLFVAVNGILAIDIDSRKVRALDHPQNLILSGDGLYFYKNSLIAVQNTNYKRVARLFLNPEMDRVEDFQILESQNPEFDIPTTGAIAEGYFYLIANSQLRSFDRDGHIFSAEKLNPVKILKIKL